MLILPKGGQSNAVFCKSYFNGNTRPHVLTGHSDEVFNISAIFTFLYFSKLEKNWLYKILLKSEQEENIFEKPNDFWKN